MTVLSPTADLPNRELPDAKLSIRKPPPLPQAQAILPAALPLPQAIPAPIFTEFSEPSYSNPQAPVAPVDWNDFVESLTPLAARRRIVSVKTKSSAAPMVAGIGIGGLVMIVLLILGVVYAVNESVNGPLQKVIANDSRNKGVEAKAYYGNFSRSVLVFDLSGISAGNSRLDVFRIFLQFSQAVKDKRFDSVQLAWHGKVKFILAGDYFHKLGEEFDVQNPVYTIRTFPENLRTPAGDRAFPEWEGGVLGVLNAQMEDFNRFHDQWYLDDVNRSL